MSTVLRGSTLTLEFVVEPATALGPVPEVTDVLVDIINPSATEVVTDVLATEDPFPPEEGTARWTYDFEAEEDAALGEWTIHWTATVNGDDGYEASETFEVTAVPIASISDSSICNLWTVAEDLPCYDSEGDLDLYDRMILAASSNLYELSNRKFPGICEKTVTACSRRTLREVWRQNSFGDYRPVAVCGCHRADQCGCSTLSAIRLPQIVEVSEILIDGVEVDPSDYRVDGGMEIVSLADPWPCCDIQITYTAGRMPPADGVVAAQVLACELIYAASPDSTDRCRLPKGVTSIVRNGIQITIKPEDLTGLFEVANFLQAHNPKNLRGGPAIVMTPDVPRLSRRITI